MKGQATSVQEIDKIPDAILPADGKAWDFLHPFTEMLVDISIGQWNVLLMRHLFDKLMQQRLFLRTKIMAAGIFNKLKKLVQVVGKGDSWMNDKVVKPIMPITNALLQSLGPAGSMEAKGISAGSSAVDALFGPNIQQSKQQFKQDFKIFRQDDFLRQKVPIDIISKHIQLLGNEFW
ncbi:MAG: hypothetical protein EZS28_017106 [Streblomastix strix]|uniref:Uncharacterized protein n=1 Tax=Streblomastix strix TaxID=222440 RepID=A0A5J4VXN8_9EUKA|nr:MAG: hypothetical protein EZS28_017106 [Streblomastix strix]